MRIDFVRHQPPGDAPPIVKCFVNDKAAAGDFIAKAEAAGGQLITSRRAAVRVRNNPTPEERKAGEASEKKRLKAAEASLKAAAKAQEKADELRP